MNAISRFHLDGQVAVITGASGGIGRATALALAEAGAEVVLHANRRPEIALSAVRIIQKGGGKAAFLSADLALPEKQDAFLEGILSMYPSIDIWINAAGVDLMSEAVRHQSFEEKLELLWNVDLLAAARLSRQIGAKMKKERKGTILFFGWDGTARGMEGDTAQLYGSVKGAVLGFAKSLAQTLAPEVRINCISPGWVATNWGQSAPEPYKKRGAAESLLNRWGSPEDVASAALFLVSEAASFLNAENLTLNGGFNYRDRS